MGHVRVYAKRGHIIAPCTIRSSQLAWLVWPRRLGCSCSVVRQVSHYMIVGGVVASEPNVAPRVDQDAHGQHGHGRILLNDAANYKIQLPLGDFF